MLKKVLRKKENSESWQCFVNRVRYITNQGHPHHKLKKVVQAAINFGCLWGQTAKDFIRAVDEVLELWKLRSRNKKGGGNPTKDMFFELVYSAPKWLRTTAKERTAIDQMITAPFRNCPIRRGWHLANWEMDEAQRPKNWKPIDDSHYLISARDNFGNATISSRFGDGKETLESWMRRMDQEICDMLNQSREMQFEPVHVIHRRRLEEKLGVKLTKLYELIAHHTSKPVTRENLADVIEQLQQPSVKGPGNTVPVAKITNQDRSLADDKLVWVHFTNRQKPRKFRIKKLLLDIAETQLDNELTRPDGNDGHEGGAGGENGGGTGCLGGVAPAAAQPGSPESARNTTRPISPDAGTTVPRPDSIPTVSKSVLTPSGAPMPVATSTTVAESSLAADVPSPLVKRDPAQSTTKPAAVKPGPTHAATGPDPAIPGTMPPLSASSVPAVEEPPKSKAVSSPPTQAAETVRHPETVSAHPSRRKARWRPKPQPKGPNPPGIS